MGQPKRSAKRPQAKRKTSCVKSQFDRRARLSSPNPARQKTAAARIPLVGNLASQAECHLAAGQRDAALTIHRETLRIRQKTLGARHPDTLKKLGALADCYVSLKQFDCSSGQRMPRKSFRNCNGSSRIWQNACAIWTARTKQLG